MNKTININIGGRIFNMEENAYRLLEEYLKALKTYFATRESGEEILADIEARIAELFDERMTPAKQVVVEKDVKEVITIMGQPQDYMDAEEDAEEEERARDDRRGPRRRVYRDPDDKVIFGVCSGISAYLGWDPIVLRGLFVIALLLYGTGPLLYVILAIIIPKATTTAEKLRMRGEPVNVDNISKKVRESFRGVKEDVDDFGKRHRGATNDVKNFGRRLGDLISDLFEGLLRALGVVFRILAKVIGAVLLIAGFMGVFLLIALAFGIGDGFLVFDHNGVGMEDQVALWLDAFFTSPTQQTLAFIGAAAVLAVPMVGLVIAGLRLLFDYRKFSGFAAVIMILVFVVGLGLLAAVGINTSRDFVVETTLTERVSPPAPMGDTLVVDVWTPGTGRRWSVEFDDARFYYSGSVTFPGVDSTNILFYGENRLTVDNRPGGSEFELRIERSSRGGSQKKAMKNAEMITGLHQFAGDSLRVYPYHALLKGAKIRDPELDYVLSVPRGSTVYFTPASEEVIYDVPNVTNTHDDHMVGHYWRMTDRGLECTDCTDEYLENTRYDD